MISEADTRTFGPLLPSSAMTFVCSSCSSLSSPMNWMSGVSSSSFIGTSGRWVNFTCANDNVSGGLPGGSAVRRPCSTSPYGIPAARAMSTPSTDAPVL